MDLGGATGLRVDRPGRRTLGPVEWKPSQLLLFFELLFNYFFLSI